MSGGEWDYKQWWITEIANSLKHINPVLADQLYDLHKLVDRYDYYICGDIGEDSIQKAWQEYREKWMVSGDHIPTILKSHMDAILQSFERGHMGR